MSEPASISSGIAQRYASAVFDLAKDQGMMPTLEYDVESLDAALRDSADLRSMVSSPVVSRDQQGAAIAAVAQAMGLSYITANALKLMAAKRRLFILPQFVSALRDMIAEFKGELTAEVKSAVPLSDDQINALAYAIHEKVGKFVKINSSVDPSLIGGLVVKVSSKMIDTSIAARLANLQNAMKEVG